MHHSAMITLFALVLLTTACGQDPDPVAISSSPTETSNDHDGDGFTVAMGDCDDHDPERHPNAQEICDDADVDEDCDGLSDDHDESVDVSGYATWFVDGDGDGVGAGDGTPSCDGPENSTIFSGDCDDADPEVNPHAAERCDHEDQDCDGEDDEGLVCPWDTPTPGQETPSPTPTEPSVRTPYPYTPPDIDDEWYGLTALKIADEGIGQDYNGDSRPDNAIYAALEATVDGLMTITHDILVSITDYPDQTDACETAQPTCSLTPAEAAATEVAIQLALDEALSVSTLNIAIQTAFDVTEVPWAFQLSRDEKVHGLTYFSGEGTPLNGGTFTVADTLGTQYGDLYLEKDSLFGPDPYWFEIKIPTGEESITIGFQLQDALSTLLYSPTGMADAYTGGGLELVVFVEIINEVLAAFDEAGWLPESFDYEAAIAQVEAVLVSASDITCSETGNPCFSITFVYDASRIEKIFGAPGGGLE